MRVILVCVKEQRDLQPLVIGLIEQNGWSVIGSMDDPIYRSGYYEVALRATDTENGSDMIYMYERGIMYKVVCKADSNNIT